MSQLFSGMKKIIHIDMDCFYAAIEIRDRPELADKPVAVGGDSHQRGVLCTCNYVARQYGLHSAMPTYQARRLCPDLVVLPVDFAKYRETSAAIAQLFQDYTDKIQPLSLDEAYLDVSDNDFFKGSATLIAEDIRQRIYKNHRITASAGVSVNKLIAKVASDWHKPNGICVIRPEHVEQFMWALPITKLFGVGKVTAKKLDNIGVKTCADLQRFSLPELSERFGKFGLQLYQNCRGIDKREVDTSHSRKSVSVEHTLSENITDIQACVLVITKLYERLQSRLDKHSERSMTKAFVKIKFDDFSQTTVERCLTELSEDPFYDLLVQGLQRSDKPIRLLGVGVRLADEEAGQQLPLLI